VVLWLLDHGANINNKDFFGFQPLWYSMASKHTEIADILRARGGEEGAGSCVTLRADDPDEKRILYLVKKFKVADPELWVDGLCELNPRYV